MEWASKGKTAFGSFFDNFPESLEREIELIRKRCQELDVSVFGLLDGAGNNISNLLHIVEIS
jgi:hypothetical protein